MKTVAIVSGGMDSVTLAYHLADLGHELSLLTFDYGQRHNKEITYAESCAARLNAEFQLVDVRSLQPILAGSSLTSKNIEVPDGHYEEESMKATVVANRNAIMISIAAGWMVSSKADSLAVGVHGGDHFIYPDCRPEFLDSIATTIKLGNEGFLSDEFQLLAPFQHNTKGDIAKLGERLGVPWKETWSCYRGQQLQCGTCGTCVERQEAFLVAGVDDPTDYAAPVETGSQ